MAADPIRSTNLDATSSAVELLVNFEMGPAMKTGRMPVAAARQLLIAAVAPPVAHVSQLTLDWPAGVEARVYDSSSGPTGVYRKNGPSGSGSWTRIGPLPESDVSTKADKTALADEVAARKAAIMSLPLAVPIQHRPGDAPLAFGRSLVGDENSIPALPVELLRFGDAGRVVSPIGADIVAPRQFYPVEPNRRYLVTLVVQRRVNTPDPVADAVRCALAWYGQSKERLGGGAAQTIIQDLTALTIGSGRTAVRAVISRAAGEDIDIVSPAAARYCRPYVETIGTLGRSDIEVISWTDITDAVAFAPDVSAVSDRLSAVEALDLGDRMDAQEAATVAPNTLRFKTRSDAQAASPAVSVQMVELLGFDAPGVGGCKHRRVGSDPGHPGAYQSANGVWWEIDERQPSVDMFDTLDATGVIPAESAFEAAAAYAIAKGIREVSVPAGEFNLAGASHDIHRVLWRGEGKLIGYRTPSAKPGQLNTFRMPPGIIPELHLKRILASDQPVVVFLGDSLTGYDVVSPLNVDDALTNKIKLWLRSEFPEKKFTFHNRGIGGARWADMGDVWPGPTWPTWYTDPDRKWLEYLRDLDIDAAFASSGMNDGALWDIGNFPPARALSVLDTLRGFQNEPDIVLCTNLLPSKATGSSDFNTEYAQEGRDAIAGWVRSVAAVSNYYGLLDFNRWMNVARDGRDVLDCSFHEASALVASQAIPFLPGIKCHDYIMRAEFTSIAADFWSQGGVHPIEIRLSGMPGNVAFLDAPGGKLRLRIYSGTGQLAFENKPTITAPTAGANVKIIMARQGASFLLKVNDDVLFDDVVVSYGGIFQPMFIYEGNPSGMTGTFTLMPGRPMSYAPQVLDKEVFLGDDDPIVGANPWNHPTGYGSDVVYAPLLALNGRGPVLSPETRALTDLRTGDGVLFDFVTRTYAMRSRTSITKNRTGPVSELVLDTAGGALSYATHATTGENIGLRVATGSQGAHILLSSIPFSATEGTMMVEGYVEADADPGFLAVVAGAANFGPRIDFIALQSGFAQFSVVDDASDLAVSAALQCECVGRFVRMILGWKANDFDMSTNGWRYLHDDLGNLPTGLERIKLGHASGTVQAGVVIRRLLYLPRKASMSELASRAF